jgi:hypothetical protein
MVWKLRKMLLFIVIATLILPTVTSATTVAAQFQLPANPISAQAERKALILSPINELVPMRRLDLSDINDSLTQAGYTVTYASDTAVTLNLLTTQLNSYEVVILRTNVYDHFHVDYYYIGQLDNSATALSYASDFASGALDNSHGHLGASISFFYNHFGPGSLSNVKLFILVTSMASALANILVHSGVKSVINFDGVFSLQFGVVDYVTGTVLRFLANGYDVADSVSLTMAPFLNLNLRDPIDYLSVPSLVYTGDYTVTIT